MVLQDVQAGAAQFIVMNNELQFFPTGRWTPQSCGPDHGDAQCQHSQTGLATLRRDGFASVTSEAGGRAHLVTRPLIWSGHLSWLFVNFQGEKLQVEVQDTATGRAVPPFTLANSIALSNDTTRAAMHWRDEGQAGLQPVAGRRVRFVFEFGGGQQTSALYSFWVGTHCGESRGYAAGGGPGMENGRDMHGFCTGTTRMKTDDSPPPIMLL